MKIGFIRIWHRRKVKTEIPDELFNKTFAQQLEDSINVADGTQYTIKTDKGKSIRFSTKSKTQRLITITLFNKYKIKL
jgi:hypothetical protein